MPQTNFRDGSLLHICRVYRPAEVYLYMSAEIWELHEKDNRYLYCLEHLAEQQGREVQYKIIARRELHDVQLFNTFYEEFREIISGITIDMDETDVLLLNVSSGTPAMKSGLVVLATLGEYPYRLIQVKTPLRHMNEHRHKEYDVKTLWELNEDNEEGFENRCEEIACPSLSILKQEEIIKKLVESYDYEAAREVCSMLPSFVAKKYLPMIELGCARLRLDLHEANRLDKMTGMNCIPIKTDRDKKQKIFEYALGMDVKLKKKEYTDFIRAITPLIFELFVMILKHMCKLDILTEYCSTSERGGRTWDRNRLNGTELDGILQDAYCGSFRYNEVYSAHLEHIIKKKCASNKKLCDKVRALRTIEEKVRNMAAHELVSLSDEEIKRRTQGRSPEDKGYGAEDIMKLLKDVFPFAGISVPREGWCSYPDMNKEIVQNIR